MRHDGDNARHIEIVRRHFNRDFHARCDLITQVQRRSRKMGERLFPVRQSSLENIGIGPENGGRGGDAVFHGRAIMVYYRAPHWKLEIRLSDGRVMPTNPPGETA